MAGTSRGDPARSVATTPELQRIYNKGRRENKIELKLMSNYCHTIKIIMLILYVEMCLVVLFFFILEKQFR